jgi:manganese/zinc/iron transport system permease protein
VTWASLDTWIVVVAALAALACSLPGTYLVLRGMSMMGDAISHAVLPGLAAGFLLAHTRSAPVMLAGAAVAGLLTSLLTHLVQRAGRVDRGAAMGVVFTTLFAIGLILMVRAADRVDLDPGCVLYGAVELTPLDTVRLLGAEVPRAALTLAVVTLLNVAFVLVFYKELRITSFDPQLATTLGIRADVCHSLLMAVVAITCVAAFEAVGSILVVAMLIVPAATAHLLTDRLSVTLVLSGAVAVVTALLGHAAAIGLTPILFGRLDPAIEDTSTAGSMAAVGGALFALAALLSPRHGIATRVAARALLRLRIAAEDALGLLYRLEEHGIEDRPERFIARLREALHVGGPTARLAVAALARRGLVRRDGARYRMTDAGRARARDLVRSHRLWESYLALELRLPPDHVHAPAMALEHVTDPAMRRTLADRTGAPAQDPHGRAIP